MKPKQDFDIRKYLAEFEGEPIHLPKLVMRIATKLIYDVDSVPAGMWTADIIKRGMDEGIVTVDEKFMATVNTKHDKPMPEVVVNG